MPSALQRFAVAGHSFLRSHGFDFRRPLVRYPDPEREPLAAFLARYRIDTVIDVGANDGDYLRRVTYHRYRGRVLSFEPNPGAFARLQSAIHEARKLGVRAEAFQLGVGDTNEERLLNIPELDVFGSFLEPSSNLLVLDERARTRSQAKARIVRLDDFVAENEVAGNILLKSDTQGFEPHVLDGAEQLLRRVRGVQLELSLTTIYEGESLAEELLGRMRRLGFRVYAVIPGNLWDHDGGLLEMDVIFVRPEGQSASSS